MMASPNTGAAEQTSAARTWLIAFFLTAVTILVYLPAIREGGYNWDDSPNVVENPLLRSGQGLWDIWTKFGSGRGGTGQYYPLTYSIFWTEYQLWQAQPFGYHLLNVLLHACNAILVWRILRRLRVPGPLLAAAIFALHPVHAESVAWVTELKNVLSGFFFLLALLCYLRFLGLDVSGPPPWDNAASRPSESSADACQKRQPFYFLAVSLFLCALASKTVTLTLPAAILLIVWWKAGRIGWRNLLLLTPMFILGIGAGLITTLVEKYRAGAQGAEWALTMVERFLLGGRAQWFYAGKLIWPSQLTFNYPRWEVSQAVWWQYLFPLAVIAVMAALWMLRRKIGRGPLAAVLFFSGNLVPVMGFLDVYFMRYSYVADHFQYLASLGLIPLFAAAVTRAGMCLEWRVGLRKASIPVAGAVLLALGALTWRQGSVYRDSETLWGDVLSKNPTSFLAHYHLAFSLAGQDKIDEAIRHYNLALQAKPDFASAHNNLGVALAKRGEIDEAIRHYNLALRAQPDFAEAHSNLGGALAKLGKIDEAIRHYNLALQTKPDFAEAHDNLGVALARQGKIHEAIRHYILALQAQPDFALAHYNLGLALAGQGKAGEAIRHYRQAIALSPGLAPARHSLAAILK